MSKKQTVEYVIIMDKAHSDELIRMAEFEGQENEQGYLEDIVLSIIEIKEFSRVYPFDYAVE